MDNKSESTAKKDISAAEVDVQKLTDAELEQAAGGARSQEKAKK